MAKSLVIVESPAKARTINRYLGDAYSVKASMGHVRDLPKKSLAVDIEHGFEPTYQVIDDKKQVISEIKKEAKGAEAIYIATDPDREGEAIGWHLVELLDGRRDDRPVFRVLLEEITESGIQRAFETPGDLDMDKVNAQQARRILDRLVGYKISPLLWEKVRRGISAGRVQSVALRLVVDREREIEVFESQEYWSIRAHLEGDEPPTFEAELRRKDGEKVEISDAAGAASILAELGVGELPEDLVAWVERAGAEEEADRPAPLRSEGVAWRVEKVEAKERKRRPKPPFITSQLQQAAARRLRFSVRKTMTLAQQLYEGIDLGDEGSVGLITYMRTDSTRLSSEAQKEAKQVITEAFGAELASAKPRNYKSRKGAQEAHEAIRPTSAARLPDMVKPYLDRDQFRLYELIWKRFVASQMKDAVYDATSVDISAGTYAFRATGSVLKFPGFLAAYADAPEDEEKPSELPPLREGQLLSCLEVRPRQHFTQPPPRYTEASLVRELERNGIGRPSTYAEILSKIRNRDYVRVEGGRFHPTELGGVVTDLLVESFERIMDIQYTAKVEDRLDRIEAGKEDWVGALDRFWKRFSKELEVAEAEMRDIKREEIETEEVCEECGKPMVIKWGRFGRFLACTGYPECRNTKQVKVKGEGADIEVTEVEVAAPEPTGEDCPKCGSPLVRRVGRFGPFIGCSNFPKCRYVKPKSTGVPCPECGEGDVVEKRTRKGRIFWGCDRFPDCKFATWKKPVPLACPSCDNPYLVISKRKNEPDRLTCPNDDCDYVTEAAEPVEA